MRVDSVRTVGVLAAVGLGLLGLVPPAPAAADAAQRVLVVSPHGSDDNCGYRGSTVAHDPGRGARLATGGHVKLRGGVYHQRIRLVGVHARHDQPVPARAPGPVRVGPDATGRNLPRSSRSPTAAR